MENDNNLKDETGQATQPTEKAAPAEKSKASASEEKQSFAQRVKEKFNEYKGEFRKIIWPGPKDLKKKSITVVFVSLMFAALIFCIDSVYNLGIEFLIGLFG